MGETLEKFFASKFFRVPNYQRDFTWDVENVDDLIDDIIEAIETSTNHYIGTFILSKTNKEKVHNIVDGQQRLTTLIMLLNEAIMQFGSDREQIIFGDRYVKADDNWRLILLNDNATFFENLLLGNTQEPTTTSQERLFQASERIKRRVTELKHIPEISERFIDTICNLDVMEFTESDDGKAIRMFQTVNDRGKPLTNIEKAKSLLIYYSNRFLDAELDEYINQKFGEIFHYYTTIKTAGEKFSVDVISSNRFSEDSVMRYHYLAYATDMYDYYATENDVLDIFLKKSLKPIRKDKNEVRRFIKSYTDDLHSFFDSFARLSELLGTHPMIYKLFSILGISTRLYPLIIRLEEMGRIDPINDDNGLLRLIELADFRVYKIRGTDPQRDMSYLARDAKNLSVEQIEQKLVSFTQSFMNDIEFSRQLQGDLRRNPALKHIYIEYEEDLFEEGYTIDKLISLNLTQPTIEHIFPREPTFDFPMYGFDDIEEYVDFLNTLGNFTLLEKELNSKCQNKIPDQKMDLEFYGSSKFEDARRLSARMINEGVSFEKKHVVERLDQIKQFCLQHWAIKRQLD